MNDPKRISLVALATLVALGCGGGDEPLPIDPSDDFFPLEAPGLWDDAPSNDTLPEEGKADEILPPQFDIRANLGPIKDQGRRGVCSIFATTALAENLYRVEGTFATPNFSEQFLQWSTKVELGRFTNTSGSSADVNLQAFQRFGNVLEADWPYEPAAWGASDDERCTGEENERPVICHTNGNPPMSALAARRWFTGRPRWISTRVNSIKSHIFNTGTGVQVGGDFFYQAWGHGGSRLARYSGYRDFGYVIMPNDEDVRSSREHRAGHSFTLVGWDDDLEVQAVDSEGQLATDDAGEPIMQRGFFLFMNSWGTGWATQNPMGRGFGWIQYQHVERFLSGQTAEVPRVSLTEICNDGVDNTYNGLVDCADPMCAGDRACIDPAGSYESTTAVAIPDADPMGIRSTITVPDGGTVSSLSVEVDITHTYRGDLIVRLERGEQSVTLHEREGGGADDLKRTYEVSDFNGQDAAGDWTLHVVDAARADTGTLNRWALTFTRCMGGECESMPETLSGSNETLHVIPDNDPAGVSSSITLTGDGTIATVRVTVNVTHTFLADLVVTLQKDDGMPIGLLREEFVSGTMLVRTFTVDALNGEPAAGTYTLNVADVAPRDEGTLNAWSVEVVTN